MLLGDCQHDKYVKIMYLKIITYINNYIKIMYHHLKNLLNKQHLINVKYLNNKNIIN